MAVKFSVLNSHSNLALDLDVAEGLLALPLLFFFSLFALLAAVEVEAAAAAGAGAAPAISRVLATGARSIIVCNLLIKISTQVMYFYDGFITSRFV